MIQVYVRTFATDARPFVSDSSSEVQLKDELAVNREHSDTIKYEFEFLGKM